MSILLVMTKCFYDEVHTGINWKRKEASKTVDSHKDCEGERERETIAQENYLKG